MRLYRDCFKRLGDILVSGVSIVLLMPALLVIALLVWISLGRPVFFTQLRPGRGGVPFRLVKFRTMKIAYPDAPESDQERLTSVGRRLRSLSLDELPELFNVLKGDMSLVGPRPLLMEYLDRYTPRQARRHEVRPGITGWAQVHGRNSTSWESRFEHDLWYVDNLSFAVDFKILVKTAATVLKREGIAASGHVSMPRFMGSRDTQTNRNGSV